MRRAAAVVLFAVACGSEGPGALPPDAAADSVADAGPDVRADVTADVQPDVAPLPRMKPWERMPGLDYLGGALLTAPKIVTITFAGDDAQLVSRLTLFDDTITQTPWWTAATSEYCVQPANTPCIGPGQSGGHVVLPGPAPASLKDTVDGAGSTVVQLLQDHIFSGELPAPDAQTLYVLWFPAGTSITMDGMTSCSSFGAYHYSAGLAPMGSTLPLEAAYAVEPRCSGEPFITVAASHEILEAATDAHPGGARGYALQDLGWQALGDENGDVCDHSWGFDTMTQSTFEVQRAWSNTSARAGHDPCVPAPPDPYFDVAPESGGQVIYLAVGESRTLELDAWSDKPTAPWTLSAVDLGPNLGAGAALDLQLDKTTVGDGDTAHLTVTLTKKPTRPDTAYDLVSKGGGKTHHWGASVRLK